MSSARALRKPSSRATADAGEPYELAVDRHLPREVIEAKALDWGVFIDAYLTEAARVGDRFAATAYCDQSGVLSDGMTVATHSVRHVTTRGLFKLVQTLDGADHYVVASECSGGGSVDGDCD